VRSFRTSLFRWWRLNEPRPPVPCEAKKVRALVAKAAGQKITSPEIACLSLPGTA